MLRRCFEHNRAAIVRGVYDWARAFISDPGSRTWLRASFRPITRSLLSALRSLTDFAPDAPLHQ
jgi:hypothetical protein